MANAGYRIAFGIYAINATFMLFTGLVCQFSDRFMPYHSAVIGKGWEELARNEKVLYVGMMRTEAAGFLASALAIAILLLIPFRRKERWASFAIFCVGVLEYLPTAVATYLVAQTSNGNPPWALMFAEIGSLCIALGFIIVNTLQISKS